MVKYRSRDPFEFNNYRLFADESGATLSPSDAKGSSLVSTLVERSRRSRANGATRLRKQDQHADDRFLEAAALHARRIA